jgi:predicted nucleotide-binding protein
MADHRLAAELTLYLQALDDQDRLLADQAKTKKPEVSMEQNRSIRALFEEINTRFPMLLPPPQFHGNPAAMQSQIRAARSKLELKRHELPAQTQVTHAAQPVQTDKRKVMVVYGRNDEAREALFAFLHAINLSPIEWGEAIKETKTGSPYIGTVLGAAFASAQAAVVLLTGDDLSRLGRRYLKPHDPHDDKYLTPQARPNVLFEAGMAFGIYPERSIIVSLGTVRKFSDIDGRHVIHLSDSFASRQDLADRLRTAGCLVETEGKKEWHKAGNFAAALHDNDIPVGAPAFRLKRVQRRTDFNDALHFKRKVWFQIRNDGDECVEIRHSGWKTGPGGITATIHTSTLQIKLGNTWCPEAQGIDRMHLPSGEMLQTWIEPAAQHTKEEIDQRFQSDAPIGSLTLLVNGVEVDFPV